MHYSSSRSNTIHCIQHHINYHILYVITLRIHLSFYDIQYTYPNRFYIIMNILRHLELDFNLISVILISGVSSLYTQGYNMINRKGKQEKHISAIQNSIYKFPDLIHVCSFLVNPWVIFYILLIWQSAVKKWGRERYSMTCNKGPKARIEPRTLPLYNMRRWLPKYSDPNHLVQPYINAIYNCVTKCDNKCNKIFKSIAVYHVFVNSLRFIL